MIAEKWGFDDIVEVLKAAENKYPKGVYMRYGPSNNAKLWPMDNPEGLNGHVKENKKGYGKPLPAKKSQFKYYGDSVFGVTHGYDEDGKVIRGKVVAPGQEALTS